MNRLDSLWKFYEEHASQARAHEDQRERLTGLLLTIAGALIAFFGGEKATSFAVQVTGAGLLVVLGIYGYFFSLKHYERNRFHTEIMGTIRSEIDQEISSPGKSDATLGSLRETGEKNHYEAFPRPRKQVQICAKSPLARIPLNQFWAYVPLFAALVGACLGIAAYCSR
jgi:hypothetical protein